MSDEAVRILAFLRERAQEEELTLLASSDRAWDVLLPSYWKETLAVSLELGDWNLRGESFFMRGPEENRAETFHLLLQRNRRPGPWRFAANEGGDISLLASIPRAAVTEEELDRLLGSLVQITDETFVPAMKLGYERGLAEQVERGGPGLDQPPPWAR
ncbi:MAG TPA: YbjN domain-containing protein [Actinomycetota bacterium]